MIVNINDKDYSVIITYKNIKNMYLRVKSDLCIYVTCNKFMSKKSIKKFINDNIFSISKQLMLYENKNNSLKNKFIYLGNVYDITYIHENKVIFGQNKVFIGKSINTNKWYLKMSKNTFLERLDFCYNLIDEKVVYPTLRIRKMTSRWGVCNIKTNTITLNLELIKMHTKYLDYVIIHELVHLIYPNHSKNFWDIVKKYVPNYKEYRKDMKNIL